MAGVIKLYVRMHFLVSPKGRVPTVAGSVVGRKSILEHKEDTENSKNEQYLSLYPGIPVVQHIPPYSFLVFLRHESFFAICHHQKLGQQHTCQMLHFPKIDMGRFKIRRLKSDLYQRHNASLTPPIALATHIPPKKDMWLSANGIC